MDQTIGAGLLLPAVALRMLGSSLDERMGQQAALDG